MNTTHIKKYAPIARNAFIEAVTKRAQELGIYSETKIAETEMQGDTLLIEGRSFALAVKAPRERLIKRVQSVGFNVLMEQIAYTWFNRLCAIRYMELHDYLNHGLLVLSHPTNDKGFEILEHAQDAADELGLEREQVIALKLAGNQDEALYRLLLLGQCHALHQAMPFLFEAINDETELLLPDKLTRTDSILRGLVDDIPAQDWEQVEVIGWLYQFYISEKKDQVIGKVVKSADIPAATQLFTPNWIVKYMVQNSLGRHWLQAYPESGLRAEMEYYVDSATENVGLRDKADHPSYGSAINPEHITLIDPACGSGHILVEAYDLLKAIYEERGYRLRDIPKLILENNLYGLDIDDRAAQLSGFALMMKARADDKRIFTRQVQLNILAIQSSKELDTEQLWQQLNLNKQSKIGTTSSLFTEAQTDLKTVIDDVQYHTLKNTLALFEQAETLGSLIQVPVDLAEPLTALAEQLQRLAEQGDSLQKPAAQCVLPFIRQAQILVQRYDAVVANPPYMGGKGMNAELKAFAKKQFPDSKSDLFAMFMERAFDLLNTTGYNAQVNMQSWMFLSSYEALRIKLLEQHTIITMAHLGARAFGQISGEVVQATAFVLAKNHIADYKPTFFRLIEGNEAQKQQALLNKEQAYNATQQDDFKKIPGSPVAYWVSDKVRDIFTNSPALGEVADARQGLATADNDRFLRLWHEVKLNGIGFGMENREQAQQSGLKWFPYNKGGQFRKWYGNQDFVVNWQEDGKEIKENILRKYTYLKTPDFVAKNTNYYFKSSVSWSKVTSGDFSIRFFPKGFVFADAGMSIFCLNYELLLNIGGCLNSKISLALLSKLSPTINFEAGTISKFPLKENIQNSAIQVKCIQYVKTDWNTYETSWDFQNNPLTVARLSDSVTQQSEAENVGLRDKAAHPSYTLSNIYAAWQTHNRATILEMQRLEQENNRLFIDAYGLQDELTPEVPLEQITLTVNPKYRYGSNLSEIDLNKRFQSDTLAELISYAIGCMMGRYSLDKAGLVYAHSGNVDFETIYYADTEQSSNAPTFAPDADGILPLTDQEWFKDDVTQRLRDFIRIAFADPAHPDSDPLQANLDFIAQSLCLYALKPKSGEASLDTIRRYLCTQFYKDHLKTYKKRPIYWLFSSGKNKAFECLVYLHRYNESTLAKMRTEYVTLLLGKYAAHAEQLQKQRDDASSTAEANRYKKALTALEKKQTELSEFDDKLRHYADMRISLDLDDGVKVNYGKFGDLLADVKAVTGKK